MRKAAAHPAAFFSVENSRLYTIVVYTHTHTDVYVVCVYTQRVYVCCRGLAKDHQNGPTADV
jgi:hypothetical protein